MGRIDGYCENRSVYLELIHDARMRQDKAEFPSGEVTEGTCLTPWCHLGQSGLGLCNMKVKRDIPYGQIFHPKDEFALPAPASPAKPS